MRKKAAPRPAGLTMGWREWVGLPDLGVERIKAKVDTGARTSALHAWNIRTEKELGVNWVAFDLHPLQRDASVVIPCRVPVIDIRDVRNSGGQRERRYIIATTLKLGENVFPVEISLTGRDEMGFRLLIGRTALRGRATVDPGRSFLLGRRPATRETPKPKRRRPCAQK